MHHIQPAHVWHTLPTTRYTMKLLILVVVCALSTADKLDRTYLPPASANTAGGSPGDLQTPSQSGAFIQNNGSPFNRPSSSGQQSAPKGALAPSYGASSTGIIGGNRAPLQELNGLINAGPSSGLGEVGSDPFSANAGGVSSNQEFNSGTSSLSGDDNGPQDFNNGFQAYRQPERSQAAQERSAQILRQDFQNDGETFSYSYETSNGISAEASGVATNGVQAQGAFSYTGDDGQVYSITYTADENGYQPRGDHLPTPPPIPEEILRSIEENARAAAAGTIGEGAYSPEYDSESSVQQYNAPSGPGPQQQNSAPTQQYRAPTQQFKNQPAQFSAPAQPQYNAPSAVGFNQQSARPQQYNVPSQSNQYNVGNQVSSAPTQQHGTPSTRPSSPQFNGSQLPSGPSQQYSSGNQGSSLQQYNTPDRSPMSGRSQYQGLTDKDDVKQYSGAPQTYNSPTVAGSSQQSAGIPNQFNPLASQTFNGNIDARPTAPSNFQGSRQLPSFSTQEGYKY